MSVSDSPTVVNEFPPSEDDFPMGLGVLKDGLFVGD